MEIPHETFVGPKRIGGKLCTYLNVGPCTEAAGACDWGPTNWPGDLCRAAGCGCNTYNSNYRLPLDSMDSYQTLEDVPSSLAVDATSAAEIAAGSAVDSAVSAVASGGLCRRSSSSPPSKTMPHSMFRPSPPPAAAAAVAVEVGDHYS